MSNKNIVVAGDGHLHLYPSFDIARAFSELIKNLDALVETAHVYSENSPQALSLSFPRRRESSPDISNSGFPIRSGMTSPQHRASCFAQDQKQEIFRIAFLAESGKYDYFHQIAGGKNGEFEITAGPEAGCLNINKGGKLQLCLVAGRQIVTSEKLEILGLGMAAKISDGRPAEEIVEKIIAAGGLPVLPFSPGKWLFKRGRIAIGLLKKYGKKLVVGDSALRPIGWLEPEIMRRAAGGVLPGSDPLPLANEEKYAGCYGFIYQGRFDAEKPLTAIKEIIANNPQTIVPAGRRRSLANVTISLLQLRSFR